MAVSNEQGLYICPCSEVPDALMDRAGDARDPMIQALHVIRRILRNPRSSWPRSSGRDVSPLPIEDLDSLPGMAGKARAFSGGHMGRAAEIVSWKTEQVTRH